MLTAQIEKIRQNYVNAKPQISCERAALWTESYKKERGKARLHPQRRQKHSFPGGSSWPRRNKG